MFIGDINSVSERHKSILQQQNSESVPLWTLIKVTLYERCRSYDSDFITPFRAIDHIQYAPTVTTHCKAYWKKTVQK